jgi:hypothetical protein
MHTKTPSSVVNCMLTRRNSVSTFCSLSPAVDCGNQTRYHSFFHGSPLICKLPCFDGRSEKNAGRSLGSGGYEMSRQEIFTKAR